MKEILNDFFYLVSSLKFFKIISERHVNTILNYQQICPRIRVHHKIKGSQDAYANIQTYPEWASVDTIASLQ
jgi:hypothetical protein